MTHPTPDLIRTTLDGRPQSWLARTAAINEYHLSRILSGRRPLRRKYYERIRQALPDLPPWPDSATESAA